MRIVTLLSDWGNTDYYVASLKAAIFSSCQDVKIVDLSHFAHKFENIALQSRYLLQNLAKSCPTDTIHLICAENLSQQSRFMLAKYKGQYYFSSENSIFFLLFNNTDAEIFEIKKDFVFPSMFPEKDIFVPLLTKIFNAENIENFAEKTVLKGNYPDTFYIACPEKDSHSGLPRKILHVPVMHIDSFQNVHLRISREDFYKEKESFDSVKIEVKRTTIQAIRDNFYQTQDSGVVAFFGDDNLLQISMKNGNFAQHYGINISSQIKIIFYNI
jgi:S-adenosylmethionine hydrolase